MSGYLEGIASMLPCGRKHVLLADFDAPAGGLAAVLDGLRRVQRAHALPDVHVWESSCKGGVPSYHAVSWCARSLDELLDVQAEADTDDVHRRSGWLWGYWVLRTEDVPPDRVRRFLCTLSSPHPVEIAPGDVMPLIFK